MSYERSFRVSVESALISPQTAGALVRLINDLNEPVDLPDIDAYHSVILPEFEKELDALSDYYVYPRNEIGNGNGLFRLKAWLADWHQEMPFHTYDPKWPQHGRDFTMPSNDFIYQLGLRRNPNSLEWFDEAGQRIAYHMQWYDFEGSREHSTGSEGHRLIVRRDALVRYLQAVGLDMIFMVELARHRPSNYRRYYNVTGETDIDTGTRRAYLLTGKGEWR